MELDVYTFAFLGVCFWGGGEKNQSALKPIPFACYCKAAVVKVSEKEHTFYKQEPSSYQQS